MGVAAALGNMLDGDVLAEINDHVRAGMIDSLDADQAAVLHALNADDRAAIEAALSYPEESTGRLMQRELIAVPQHWSVGQTIDYLRDDADLTTDFWKTLSLIPHTNPSVHARYRGFGAHHSTSP